MKSWVEGLRGRAAKAAVIVGVVASVAGVEASTVLAAGQDTFMSNRGLSATNAYADGNAHGNLNQVETYSTTYQACPAVASGYGGYTSLPNAGGNYTAFQSSECSAGYGSWRPNPVAGALHGAVYNNSGGTDQIYYAIVHWA